ncbi:MAG TPA: class I SAM-dependent methyltransferase, partial [Pirellulaceae bacterium]
ASVVAWKQPLVMFEFGTFDGRTTRTMSLNAPDSATIHTLDLPPAEQHLPDGIVIGERLGPQPPGRVVQLWGNSRTMNFDPYAGRVDLVFIDAAHDYESVRHDSEVALRLLRPANHGIILWHDYGRFGGVTRAADELITRVPAPRHFCHLDGTTLAFLQT